MKEYNGPCLIGRLVYLAAVERPLMAPVSSVRLTVPLSEAETRSAASSACVSVLPPSCATCVQNAVQGEAERESVVQTLQSAQ